MSNYWRKVIAVLQRVSIEGTEEEQAATYRIIEQIEQAEAGNPSSPLEEAWDKIQGLLAELELEPYIDDQYQITEIWEITEKLIDQGGLEKESWELKEKILQELYENCWYDEFGILDPMEDLEKALCTSREESLKRADLLLQCGLFNKAAKVYQSMGENQLYIDCLEEYCLRGEAKPYRTVLDYYKQKDDQAKVLEIASRAVDEFRSKEDATPFMLILMQDARARGDEDEFQELLATARAKNNIRITPLKAALGF